MTDLEPGRLVRVALGVQRLLAPNPSLLTGPGTNSYLLGDPPRAIIDPGPAAAEHVEALLAAAPQLSQIFVTHTHADHSAAARTLAARTGAQLVGRAAPAQGPQERSFRPHVEPQRDQEFALAGATLRAIDTPGHASNHVCYLLLESGMLFSGDHVLDGMTPVIAPPDGDMAAYLESLQRLRTYPLRSIAPGHGQLLGEPLARIDAVVAHRHERESKVLHALTAHGPATVEELLPRVYADVRLALYPLARQSLEAHLLKLAAEGRAEHRDQRWRALH